MSEVNEKYKKFMFNRRFDNLDNDIASTELEIKELLAMDEVSQEEENQEIEHIINEDIEPSEPVYIPPTYTQEQLDELIEKTKKESFEAGKKDAEESLLKQQLDLLTDAQKQMTEINSIISSEMNQVDTDFIEISKLIFKKLMPEMNKKGGFDEIEKIIKDSFPKIKKEPQVKIIVNSDNTAILKEKLAPIIKNAGFLGKIVIQSNEELNLSDIKIEWDKGGIVRDSTVIADEIENILNLYTKDLKQSDGEK